MILSLRDKRTTAKALRRNGLACLASEGRVARAWGGPAYDAFARPSGPSSIVSSAPLSIVFGGLFGLQQSDRRMHTAAPHSRNPRAKQEEGDP